MAFTRDPSTGEQGLYGEFLLNAQGEDVVAGIRTPRPLREMEEEMPHAFQELLDTMQKLEHDTATCRTWSSPWSVTTSTCSRPGAPSAPASRPSRWLTTWPRRASSPARRLSPA